MSRAERRQNMSRLREIAQVAARHGFGYLFGREAPEDAAAAPEGEGKQASRRSRGRRLREMLDELGPTFVKFGQLLSTRPDLLPPDVLAELRKLQDQAKPVPFEQIREVLEEDLGLTVEQVFEHFDETPIAAASIGQVHRARLPGGYEVVVKVQRPDAERRVQADIDLLYQAARVAKDRVQRLSFIDVVAVVDEFARTVRQELDYRIEARNTEAARRAFEGDETVVVPRVHWRQTGERVITLDYIEGVVLSRVDLATWGLDERRTLAARVAETWMKMIFLHGFFHADPHPANVIVIGPDRLGLIDFGMVGQLSERDREAAIRLLVDIVERDEVRIARHLRDLGVRYPREKEDEFREQLGVLVQRYYGVGLADIDAREMLHEIMGIIYGLGVELPSRWALLDKCLATLAGVGLEIYPDYNVFETATPYARQIMTGRFRPDRMAARLQSDAARYAEAFAAYPFQVGDVLEELRDGEMRITVNPEGLTESIDKVTSMGNRIAVAVMGTALFLGSAILGAFVKDGPHLLGVALISIPGLVIASLMGLWLLTGIVRSGRW